MKKIDYNKKYFHIKATEYNDKQVAYMKYNNKYGVSLPLNTILINKSYENIAGKYIHLKNALKGFEAYGIIDDCGPFVCTDYKYIFENERPYAEILKGKMFFKYPFPYSLIDMYKDRSKIYNKHLSNGAGIDLKPDLMKQLTSNYIPNKTSIFVDWKFVKKEEMPLNWLERINDNFII